MICAYAPCKMKTRFFKNADDKFLDKWRDFNLDILVLHVKTNKPSKDFFNIIFARLWILWKLLFYYYLTLNIASLITTIAFEIFEGQETQIIPIIYKF